MHDIDILAKPTHSAHRHGADRFVTAIANVPLNYAIELVRVIALLRLYVSAHLAPLHPNPRLGD